jgi:dolichol-phosphate mannosyltransferase
VANGQCTATRRDWFLEQGGYGLATGHSTDDVALIRAFVPPARIAFRDGADLLEVKMHDSAREVWREWGRSIGMRDIQSPWPDVAVLTLAMLPLLPVRVALLFALRRSYTKRGAAFWLSPLADPLSILRLALPGARTWRGEQL